MVKKASGKTKTKAKAKSKTTSKQEVATKVQEKVPAMKVSQTDSKPADKEVTLQEQFTHLLAQLSSLRSQLTSVTTQVRQLSKKTERELKVAHKNRKKRKTGNRAPSGFVKPTKISSELASFLGKEKGTEMARTSVTREINAYIRENKLQDPENGRRILADEKLSKLLKLKKGDELTYFNLQRYMSPHFAKATKSA